MPRTVGRATKAIEGTIVAPERARELTERRSWEELVDAGQQLFSRSQWELGDLACEVETGYGEGSLQRYAEQVGVAYKTMVSLRTVARAYPQNARRPAVSWSVHQALASQPDRFELVGKNTTTAQAREEIRKRAASSPEPTDSPPLTEAQRQAAEFLRRSMARREKAAGTSSGQPEPSVGGPQDAPDNDPEPGCQTNVWKLLSDIMARLEREADIWQPTSKTQAAKIAGQLDRIAAQLDDIIDPPQPVRTPGLKPMEDPRYSAFGWRNTTEVLKTLMEAAPPKLRADTRAKIVATLREAAGFLEQS